MVGSDARADGAIDQWIRNVQDVLVHLTGDEGLNEPEVLTALSTASEIADPQTQAPYRTERGNPLPYFVFESGERPGCPVTDPSEVTRTVLFIGGIHGDEISPAYSSFRYLLNLLIHPEERPANTRVIYAPLANPDGFLQGGPDDDRVWNRSARRYCYRMNPRPWRGERRMRWMSSYGSRRLPDGTDPNRAFNADLDGPLAEAHTSPTEARFIADLVSRYRPSVIISLHGPFGSVDYDGPADLANPSTETDRLLATWLGEAARDSRLREDYGYSALPGSLGAFGERRGIHVVTLEFPSKCGVAGPREYERHGDALRDLLNPPRLPAGE